MNGGLTFFQLELPFLINGGLTLFLLISPPTRRNLSDVEHEVPAATRAALEIIPCVTMSDVLENAFEGG